ncbi:nucleotide exchange factor GrpE [soil metagenome]
MNQTDTDPKSEPAKPRVDPAGPAGPAAPEVEPGTGEEDIGAATPEEPGAEGEQVPPPSDPDSEKQAEIEKWKDIALRSKADLENFRKRMARERSEAIRYGNAALLESLIPILDNFEWGLEAARAESDSSSIFQGMSMVYKQVEDFLADQGVTEVKAVGEPFDPNLHDAISQTPSDEVPEGTVIAQTRKGYRLNDRLLRPAGVVVSQGREAADGQDDA